jgi:hypothetical protein
MQIPTDINDFWKRSAKPFPPTDFVEELKELMRDKALINQW